MDGKSTKRQLAEEKLVKILHAHGIYTYESLINDLYNSILSPTTDISNESNEYLNDCGCPDHLCMSKNGVKCHYENRIV